LIPSGVCSLYRHVTATDGYSIQLAGVMSLKKKENIGQQPYLKELFHDIFTTFFPHVNSTAKACPIPNL
jgi:hypothetical protein